VAGIDAQPVPRADGRRSFGNREDIKRAWRDLIAGHGEHLEGAAEVKDFHIVEDQDGDVASRHVWSIAWVPWRTIRGAGPIVLQVPATTFGTGGEVVNLKAMDMMLGRSPVTTLPIWPAIPFDRCWSKN
jgi:hypothetical protein